MNREFEVRLSQLAEADYERIAWFIFSSSGSFEAAERVINDLRKSVGDLSGLPHKGTRRDEVLSGLRLLPVGKAVIVFTVDEARQTVFVLRLFYGGEDIPAALGDFDNT